MQKRIHNIHTQQYKNPVSNNCSSIYINPKHNPKRVYVRTEFIPIKPHTAAHILKYRINEQLNNVCVKNWKHIPKNDNLQNILPSFIITFFDKKQTTKNAATSTLIMFEKSSQVYSPSAYEKRALRLKEAKVLGTHRHIQTHTYSYFCFWCTIIGNCYIDRN